MPTGDQVIGSIALPVTPHPPRRSLIVDRARPSKKSIRNHLIPPAALKAACDASQTVRRAATALSASPKFVDAVDRLGGHPAIAVVHRNDDAREPLTHPRQIDRIVRGIGQ